jgi:hypothetical protein
MKKYSSQGKENLGDLSTAVIHDVRDSKALRQMGEVVLNHFYGEYADQPLSVIMTNLHITEDKVVREVSLASETIVGRMRESGFLEERVRALLTGFYSSESTTKILEG